MGRSVDSGDSMTVDVIKNSLLLVSYLGQHKKKMKYWYVIRCRIALLGILQTNSYNLSRIIKRGKSVS